MYAIKIIESDGTVAWVKEFDPNVRGDKPYPTGFVLASHDPADALRFPTFRAAYEFVTQQSTVTPLRPDGRPNRPLTSLNIEIGKLTLDADNPV